METLGMYWELITLFLLFGAYCANLFNVQKWFPWGGF